MTKKYIWQSSGHECTCNKCGDPILEDQPRYVPVSIKEGRICVKCYEGKR